MSKFRVQPGHTILTKAGRLAKPGDEVELSEVGEAHKEMLRDNKITQIEGREIKPLPFKEKTTPELSSAMITPDGTVIPKPTVTQTSTIEKKSNEAPVLTGIWTLNPADLANKSLEELNAMIIERAPTIPAFDDKAEAVAWLSQDVK